MILWSSFYFLLVDHTIQLTTFWGLMQELQRTVNPYNTAILPYLPHINVLLLRTVTVCRVAEKSTSQEQHLSVKDVIPPGKTIDHQWRFKQTSKTPGRKKNGLIFRCMHAMLLSVPMYYCCIFAGMLMWSKKQRFYVNLIAPRLVTYSFNKLCWLKHVI